MQYIIEDILFRRTNTTRTDGKSPQRIGSIVSFLDAIEIGRPLYFNYIKYNNGERVEDHITRTSRVDDFDNFSDKDHLYVYTKNSIYIFKTINNEE